MPPLPLDGDVTPQTANAAAGFHGSPKGNASVRRIDDEIN